MESLESIRDVLWPWVALPALAVAALLVTLYLRAPQITRLREAFLALTAYDANAVGRLHPATAIALSTAATIGAGAVVSTATAISLGGPGALAWLWLFGFLVAPLRVAEALLARTAPPGKAGKKATGSLAAHLAGDSRPGVAMLGNALFVLVPIAAIAVVGGLHGPAVVDAAEATFPGSAEAIGFGVATAAALFAIFGRDRAWLGWTALGALVVLAAACLVSIISDPSRAIGGLASVADDAFNGAPALRAFSGALAGEIARAALTYVLPVITGTLGLDGSLAALAQPRTAKGQAAAALLPVLTHVVLTTLMGLAIFATGAYARPTNGTRPLGAVVFYDSAFETTSQRLEPERQWHGHVRVIDGVAQARPLEIGTDRGMIAEPTFEESDGTPGDFALFIEDGRVERILRLDRDGVLDQVPLDEVWGIRVRGRMPPTSGALVAAAMTRGGGDLAARGAIVALFLLAALGAAGFGLGLARMFAPRVTENGQKAIAALPAIGLVLGATSFGPTLAIVGAIVAALTTVVVSIGLIAKARELAKL
jgi:Na+/alanine symporter